MTTFSAQLLRSRAVENDGQSGRVRRALLGQAVTHVAAALLLGGAGSMAGASTLYYDGDGAGTVGGGSGVWDEASLRWAATPAGSTYATWANANNDAAVFGGAGGIVQLGGPVTADSLTFGGNYRLVDPASGPAALTVTGGVIDTAGNRVEIVSPLAGTNGLTKNGTGLLIFHGGNTYTGPTVVNAGTLALGNTLVADIPNASPVTVATGATLSLNVFGGAYNDTTGALSGGGTVTLGTLSGYGVATGSQLRVGADGSDGTFSGTVTGAGGRLLKAGAGTQVLSGANTYTGITQIEDGTLKPVGGNAIPDNSALFFTFAAPGSGQAVLDLSGGNETIGSLGSGKTGSTATTGARVDLGGNTLTMGTDNRSNLYEGALVGSGHIVKVGSGVQSFANSLANWTGTLTVEGGMFVGSADTRGWGDTSNSIVLDGGGIGGFNTTYTLSATRAISVTANNGVIRAGAANLAYGASITGPGHITKTGHNTLTLSALQANAGGWTVTDGLLTLNSSAATGKPLGSGPVTVSGSRMNFQPGGTSANVEWSVADATASTQFTYGPGTTLFVSRGSNTSFTLTIGNSASTGGSLARAAGGTLIISTQGWSTANQTNLGTTERIKVNGGVATVTTNDGADSYVPYVFATGNTSNTIGEFVTYDAAAGFRTATYSTKTDIQLADNNDLFKTTGSSVLSGNTTVLGLRNGGGHDTNLNGFTLTVGDGVNPGMILNHAAAKITGGTIDFGASEGILYSQHTAGPISSAFAGSAGLTKVGFGVQVLSGNSTYAGKTTVSGGVLKLGVNDALPTGTDVVIAAGFQANGSSAVLDLAGFSQTVKSINSDNGSSVILLGAGGTLTVASGDSIFSGHIAGTSIAANGIPTATSQLRNGGTLVKDGTGTLTLGFPKFDWSNPSVANLFDRLVVRGGGTVSVVAPQSLGFTPGAGTMADQITLDNGTLRIADVTFFSVGRDGASQFFLGNNRGITLGAGGGTIDVVDPLEIANFEGTSNVISGPGNLTKTGAGTLILTGPIATNLSAANTYTGKTSVLGGRLIIKSDGSLGEAPASAVADQLTIANGAILETAADTTLAATRGVTIGSGGGQVHTPSGITPPATEAALTTLALNGTISGNGTLTKTGGGTLALNAASPGYSGMLAVTAGTVEFGASGAAGTGAIAVNPLYPVVLSHTTGTDAVLTNAVSVGAGSTVDVRVAASAGKLAFTGGVSGADNVVTKGGDGTVEAASYRLGGLVVNGGTVAVAANGTSAGTSKLGAVVIAGDTAPTAKVDLADNDLVVGGGSAAVTAAQLAAGYAGGSWTGNGIASSAAASEAVAAASAGRGARYALGYATGADLGVTTFSGQDVTAGSLLVKYTYYGDLNLSGGVDADDYLRIDRAAAMGLPARWFNGDVNYDGSINSADYLLMDAAYGQQAGVVLGPDFLAQREAQFGSEYVSSLVAAVPEPTGLGLAGVAAAGLLARRRRQA